MKKKLFSLLTALVLCLLCAVPAFAEMPLVMDTYELFKPEATTELEQKAQDASAGHGVNVYLLTVSDIGGQNVREFAKDWYRDYDLGYGEGKSGILFLIALDSRDYVTITYGGGVTAFTDYRIAQIEDKIVPMRSDGTYYKASDTYIEMCADTLDFYAEKGAPLDSGNDPAKGWIKWVFVFVIPLAVACIVCGIFYAQMKTANEQTHANAYMIFPCSYHFTEITMMFSMFSFEIRHCLLFMLRLCYFIAAVLRIWILIANIAVFIILFEDRLYFKYKITKLYINY